MTTHDLAALLARGKQYASDLERSPEIEKSAFDCPRCGAFAQQKWRTLQYTNDGGSWIDVGDAETDPDLRGKIPDAKWNASQCQACEAHSLWIDEVLVFPGVEEDAKVPSPVSDMPSDVVELYREAAATLPHSKRAAAALCRAALERLAKFLTPDLPARTTLEDRLAGISKTSSLHVAQMIQLIRHTGNSALHGHRDADQTAVIFLDEKDTTIVGHFFPALNLLVEELMSRPRMAAEIYSKLPAGFREQVIKKQSA